MAQNLKYWVWLSAIPKIGPVKRKRLLEVFGDPKKIWEAGFDDLKSLSFLNQESIKQLRNQKYREESEKNFEKIYRQGIGIITIHDDAYPYYLRNIYDPPVVIYVKGSVKRDEKAVAVVGSRRATPYGLDMAETIAYGLASRGIAVVSGMARGIDSYAHKGALKAGGRTIAVLGCGPDVVYPLENKGLMDDIIKSGAVISEYVPEVPPVSGNFPARNRIISGMSLGVVVIEAGEKSGSLITADFALEQGREVFAVPGNVSSFNSRGTNRLIKEGAKIVTCVDDILEELEISLAASSINKPEVGNAGWQNGHEELESDETRLVECLKAGPLHIDAIAAKSGLSVQLANSCLFMMELDGVVEQMPGKVFKLKC